MSGAQLVKMMRNDDTCIKCPSGRELRMNPSQYMPCFQHPDHVELPEKSDNQVLKEEMECLEEVEIWEGRDPRDQPEIQELPDQKELRDIQEDRECQESDTCSVSPDQWDSQDHVELPDSQDHLEWLKKDRMDCLDQLDHLENQECLGQWELQDSPEKPESLELMLRTVRARKEKLSSNHLSSRKRCQRPDTETEETRRRERRWNNSNNRRSRLTIFSSSSKCNLLCQIKLFTEQNREKKMKQVEVKRMNSIGSSF